MKVGDYVRTKEGKIKRIIKIRPEMYVGGHCYIQDDDYILMECQIKEKVVKSSPNIIDLIEVGDYVNGRLVEWKSEDFVAFGRLDYAYEEDIKSIVTKEQFESMKYKVGE